jgi:phosphatidate cytidylyltransferase
MTRVLSGAILITIAVAVVWLAPPLLFLASAEALLVLAAVEYARLAKASGTPVPAVAATAAAALTAAAFSTAFGATMPAPIDVVLMSAFVALGGLTVARWRSGGNGAGSAGAALLPALYLGLPIGAMVAVRETHGPAVLLLLMLTVIVSDTAQYYSGRSFGRRLLAPAISPKKTIEGAIGGFVMGGLVLAVAGHWALPSVPVPLRAALGLAVVALGITGDLFESMLKRGAGVKDSSALIPGHGGVLDRIDALLFAAPVYYVVLKYV